MHPLFFDFDTAQNRNKRISTTNLSSPPSEKSSRPNHTANTLQKHSV